MKTGKWIGELDKPVEVTKKPKLQSDGKTIMVSLVQPYRVLARQGTTNRELRRHDKYSPAIRRIQRKEEAQKDRAKRDALKKLTAFGAMSPLP